MFAPVCGRSKRGAFLAGMALAETVGHRVHDLTNGVCELLVPFFLVGIGLRFDLGALNIQTDDVAAARAVDTNFTVLRLRRDLLRRSSLGGLFTNRSASLRGPGANQTFGADATLSFYDNLELIGYVAKTRTPGLTGRDLSYQGRFAYTPDLYGVTLEHLVVKDHFNPEVGFLPRDNFRRSFVSGRFSPRPQSIEWVRQFTFEGSLDYYETADAGHLETRQRELSFETELENSDQLRIAVTNNYERLDQPFPIAPQVTIPEGAYRFSDVSASYGLGQQRRVNGSVAVQAGRFWNGNIRAIEYRNGRVNVLEQFSLEPSISFNWVDLPQGSFRTELVRTRLNYSFSPRMFLSGLLQYNSSNDTVSANLRLRWEYSPGSELFVVYTEDRDTDPLRPDRFSELRNRGFVVKMNRLVRF